MLSSLIIGARTFDLGLQNLKSHKLRSGLTVLGIVFGVCSVISMLSIGEGASRAAQDQIRRLGSQNIIVRAVKPPNDPASASPKQVQRGPNWLDYGLRYADAERLADTLPSVNVIVPIKARTDPARFQTREEQATVLGTVPWYVKSANVNLEKGRFITALDMHQSANVCVIGKKLARQIFLFRDPIGQSLKVGRNAYRVVGVMTQSGEGGEKSQDLPSQNADILVPLTTMKSFDGDLFFQMTSGSSQSEYVELHELILSVNDVKQVLPTAALVEDSLKRHHDSPDYELIVPLRLLEAAKRTQAIFSIVLGSIAAISLLVGGIGIMNIMLASVSERTREIGIRRAVGARRRDIMLQFLIECVILSIGGGLLGMGLGAVIPWLVTRFSGMATVLTPGAFVLAFAVSVFIGVVFGLYPARRAAIMDPIDALRHE